MQKENIHWSFKFWVIYFLEPVTKSQL